MKRGSWNDPVPHRYANHGIELFTPVSSTATGSAFRWPLVVTPISPSSHHLDLLNPDGALGAVLVEGITRDAPSNGMRRTRQIGSIESHL